MVTVGLVCCGTDRSSTSSPHYLQRCIVAHQQFVRITTLIYEQQSTLNLVIEAMQGYTSIEGYACVPNTCARYLILPQHAQNRSTILVCVSNCTRQSKRWELHKTKSSRGFPYEGGGYRCRRNYKQGGGQDL